MRNTLILVVLALGFGSYVYFAELRDPEGREEAERAEKRLVQVDEAEITQLRLGLADGGTALLVRDGESWRLTEPLEYGTDESEVGAFLVALADLESKSDFEVGSEELEVYGLGADAPRVEVTTSAGGAITLRLGDDAPIGGSAYALREDEPNRVHAVPGFRRRALQPELTALRDKRVLKLEPETLRGVQLERAGRLVAIVERDGEEGWKVVAPFADRADGERISRLVHDLSLIRATEFIDEPEGEASYGLDAPLIKIALGTGENAESLLLGKVDDAVYARRAGSGSVYKVSDRILEQVPQRSFELRYKQVLTVDVEAVEALALEFPAASQSYRFSKSDDGWQADDESLQVDPERIVDLVDAFELVEATGLDSGEVDLPALGLDPPQVRVTLLGAEGAELARLELGELELGRGIPARASQEERVWRVINDLGEDIPLNAEAFANRWIEADEESAELGSDDPP